MFGMKLLDKLKIDDVVGAIPAHICWYCSTTSSILILSYQTYKLYRLYHPIAWPIEGVKDSAVINGSI